MAWVPSDYEGYFSMNVHVAPWDNICVRRAVAYALDRANLVKALGIPGQAVTTLIPPDQLRVLASQGQVSALVSSIPSYPYNLSKAKAEMAMSSYPHGFTAPTNKLNIKEQTFTQWIATADGPKTYGNIYTAWVSGISDPSSIPALILGRKTSQQDLATLRTAAHLSGTPFTVAPRPGFASTSTGAIDVPATGPCLGGPDGNDIYGRPEPTLAFERFAQLDERGPACLNIVQAIEAELQAIGIRVQIKVVPVRTWAAIEFGPSAKRMTNFAASGCVDPDPSNLVGYDLGSWNVQPGGEDTANYAPPQCGHSAESRYRHLRRAGAFCHLFETTAAALGRRALCPANQAPLTRLARAIGRRPLYIGLRPRVDLRSRSMADSSVGMGPVVPSDAIVETPVKPRLRGVSHEVAAFVFPLMGLAAVLIARSSTEKLVVAIYAAGVSGMYATSACYHRANWAPATRSRVRRLDHSMILVAIASTYTPVAVIALSGSGARRLLAVVWGLALGGVLVRNLWLSAPRWVMAAFYMGVGWTAVVVLPSLLAALGGMVFALLIAGGVVYSLGALVLSRRWPDPMPAVFGYHEVFHALVLVAGTLFYLVVIELVVRR